MSRAEHIAAVVKDGMPPDLAPRAVDAFEFLLTESDALLDMSESEEGMEKLGWMRYGFMQGFVAGSMASVHHN